MISVYEESVKGQSAVGCGSWAVARAILIGTRGDFDMEENTGDESVSLVRGVRAKDVARLAGIGIVSYRQLSGIDLSELRSKLGWTESKCRDVALNAKALAQKVVIEKAPLSLPDGVVYFYDVETLGALTYLHGVIRLEVSVREERSFIAGNPSDEGVVWREFLDYMAQDEKATVYSWSEYERNRIQPLWEKYGGNRAGWKLLSENLVDQSALMKKSFALPTKSYSIKKVAPIFGFEWHTPFPDGRKAEEWYRNWLLTGDKSFLDEIVTYNLDDVRAMEAIYKAVRR